jgi:hypothetical protein
MIRSATGIQRHLPILRALENNDPALVVAALPARGHLHYLDIAAERLHN